MKNNNKKPLKILAGIIAITLISAMLFITNAFVGNPISAMKANNAIAQYVKQNYSHIDLEVGKVAYDFKSTGYKASVTSKTSIDTKFAIYYSKGKVQRDDYQDYVLGMFNTLDRLSREYSTIATNIIAEELGYENNATTVIYDKDNYDKSSEFLELDIKFDKSLPLNPEVNIQITLSDHSIEEVAKILTNAHEEFLENNCIFTKYTLYLQDGEKNIMVIGVTPVQIESGELESLLQKADINGAKEPTTGTNGIVIFRKGEAK